MLLRSSPKRAAALLKKLSPLRPQLAIVLGTGFETALAELRVAKKIPYSRIPGFPQPTVPGTMATRSACSKLKAKSFSLSPVLEISGNA